MCAAALGRHDAAWRYSSRAAARGTTAALQPPGQILYETRIQFRPFWQESLLQSMFFTSNVKEFVLQACARRRWGGTRRHGAISGARLGAGLCGARSPRWPRC